MDPTNEQVEAWLAPSDNDGYDQWISKYVMRVFWASR
jgi:hypothetical protein